MGTDLHPTAALMLWLSCVMLAQFFSYAGLAVLIALVFISVPSALGSFFQFVRRGRWLLMSLWLIFAYGKAGDPFAGLSWMPTLEGVAEANLQAIRLLTLLACLAWLFALLGREGMLSALWGSLRPLLACGLDAERLVVRLALVLNHLQTPLSPGAWKNMLLKESLPESQEQTVSVSLPQWSIRDQCLALTFPLSLLWIVLQ